MLDVSKYGKMSLDEIREKDYVLTPGRYIGLLEMKSQIATSNGWKVKIDG